MGRVLAGLLLAVSVAGGEEEGVAAAHAEFETLKGVIVGAFGSRFSSPVTFEVVEEGSFEKERARGLEGSAYFRERLEARGRLFEKLRLEPGRFLRALHEAPAAWYVEHRHLVCARKVVLRHPLRIALRGILLHELVHAHRSTNGLYQHVGGHPLGPERDRFLARRCACEGDAVLLSRLIGSALELGRKDLAGWLRRPEEAARALEQGLDAGWLHPEGSAVAAPYLEGFSFVSRVYRERGLDGLERALREPPRSTEQILHPEKYLSDRPDEPTRFASPEAPDPVAPGWSRIDRGTLGEYDLECLFRVPLGAGRARLVATGWDGSFYHLHAPPETGACLLALITTWDRDVDAQEFALAWCDWAGRRDGGPYRVEVLPTGAGARRTVATDDGKVVVVRRGRDVIVLDGLRGVDREPILRAFWDTVRVTDEDATGR